MIHLSSFHMMICRLIFYEITAKVITTFDYNSDLKSQFVVTN